MNFRIRVDPRLASVLAISLAFAAAASIMFVQLLGFMSGRMNLARLMFFIPVLGMAAVAALTWWVIFPRWLETKRVQKLVRAVTGVGQADIDLETTRNFQKSKRLRLAWVGGMAAAVALVFLLRSNVETAPLWAPLAIVTVIVQANMRQTIEERGRALLVCGLLVFVFGGVGRTWLSSTQGSVLLVVSLFALISWHFWQEKRGVVEMQGLVREARYDQAIAKAEVSASNLAPALKAYAQFRQGDTAAAKFGLRVALAKAVDSSKASFALAKYGELLLAEGQIDESIAPVEAALQLQPEEARAHRVMAQILLEQIENVQRGFMKRQRDQEQHARLLAHAGAEGQRQNQPALIASALDHACKASEKAPGRGAELAVLAWAQAAAGKQEDAQQTVHQASQTIADQLDVAEGRYFLGRAYRMMGHRDWATSSFEAVRGAESRGHYRNLADKALAELAAGDQAPVAAAPAKQASLDESSVSSIAALESASGSSRPAAPVTTERR